MAGDHQLQHRHQGDTRPPSVNAEATAIANGSAHGRQPWPRRVNEAVVKFASFIGPGFMIAVAYIDPGNYSTGVAAGATYQYRLLFIVLMANIAAIFLQTLCIKLGTVTGLNLAQACRLFLPTWLNIVLYVFAEAAIIATDIAEVIGFAIALNLLVPAIPLVAGCAISILDVMLILLFYNPHGSMKGLRLFELFIMALVMGVVVCFCIQLSLIKDSSVAEVFRGYLPSSAITESKGLYQACGILGATVMPHSLYLGSGIVQPRLRAYDVKHGLALPPPSSQSPTDENDIDVKVHYTPSLDAIRHSYRTSTLELGIALFTFALFVNSAIVIVSGASLYPSDDDADLFSIHALLSASVSPAAGTVFALSLLLSGVSAGIVCTIAGQMVCEGALHWRVRRPWLRRLITRSISITPSIIIAGAVGQTGLSAALNASQVVLSIVLPFVSAPLIWFTCRGRYMTVRTSSSRVAEAADSDGRLAPVSGAAVAAGQPQGGPEDAGVEGVTKLANSWYTIVFAVLVWLAIAVLNVANLVLLGLGKS
ncbi:natural resistance-associated macrophage protein-domain-containing protein [Microdochium bolleyi]|uniref:Natural resistance-associated macrophage protein-domain-containing protein n=1 Tax=Microdochium bolleyi TaxID=196109 RepID=A0A136IVP6_9PEZI|nr:natural resistance-associated macrophage protein-domain-containing protein [Microdochium bolleyi]